MPATLSGFWTAETSRLSTELGIRRAALVTASADEAAAADDLALTGKQLQEARARAEAARKALSGIPMPADGDPLLTEMRQALIDQRAAAALQVEADASLRQLRARRAALAMQVSRLEKSLDAAQARLKAEERAHGERQKWVSAAGSAPLKDLPAAASAALASFAAGARAKVEADFPANAGNPDKDFLTRVRVRRQLALSVPAQAAAVLTDALSTARTWEEGTTREQAKLAALERDFARRASALKAFFDAPARVRLAGEQLKALANRPASPLSLAQRRELNTNDATLKGLREDMLPRLKTRDDAQADLLAAEQTYATTLLATLLANPGKSEAELLISDATLKAKRKDVDDAAQAVDDAENDAAYIADLPELEAWFAAVPDALWEQLETLDAAIADLDAIKTATPATLISDLATAEDALATQLARVRDEQLFEQTLTETLHSDTALVLIEDELAAARAQAAARFVERV